VQLPELDLDGPGSSWPDLHGPGAVRRVSGSRPAGSDAVRGVEAGHSGAACQGKVSIVDVKVSGLAELEVPDDQDRRPGGGGARRFGHDGL
jgi:hypothetical protein